MIKHLISICFAGKISSDSMRRGQGLSVTGALSWGRGLVLSGRTSRVSTFGVATDLQQNHEAGTEDRSDSLTEGAETKVMVLRGPVAKLRDASIEQRE